MKKIAVVVVLILFSNVLYAGNIGFIGAGARSSGMGGAFIAVADDATSIFWNPAGLTHLLEQEISIVGRFDSSSWKYPESISSVTPPALNTFTLNFASFAYPTKIFKRNFTFAISTASVYDMNFTDSGYETDNYGNIIYRTIGKCNGMLYRISSGFAYDILPDVSFGTAFNWHYGKITDLTIVEIKTSTSAEIFRQYQNTDIKGGSGISFGLFANLPYKWHIGGVTKITLDDMIWNGFSELIYNDYGDGGKYPLDQYPNTQYSFLEKRYFPNTYGIGLSFTPTDYVTIAADYSMSKWSQYKINKDEPKFNNGERMYKDVIQLHFGCEYLLPKSFINDYPMPLRVGLYTDPYQQRVQNTLIDTSGKERVVTTDITATFLTFGSGFVFDFGQLDFSVEYGVRDWGFNRTENIIRLITSTILKI